MGSLFPSPEELTDPSIEPESPALQLDYLPAELPGKPPVGASGKESACQCRRHKGCRFYLWVGRILWRRKWQPTPVFLPGKFHGQRSLAIYSPWTCRESDTTEHTHMHAHTHTRTHTHTHTHTHTRTQPVVYKCFTCLLCLVVLPPIKKESHDFCLFFTACLWCFEKYLASSKQSLNDC